MKQVYVVKRRSLEVPVYVAKSKKEAELKKEEYTRLGLGGYTIEPKMINEELYSDIFRTTIKFN